MVSETSLETNESNHYAICLLSCPRHISWTPTFTLQATQHQPYQDSSFLPHSGNIIRQRYQINYILINYLYNHSTLITFS